MKDAVVFLTGGSARGLKEITGLWETQDPVWEACTGAAEEPSGRGHSCRGGMDMEWILWPEP